MQCCSWLLPGHHMKYRSKCLREPDCAPPFSFTVEPVSSCDSCDGCCSEFGRDHAALALSCASCCSTRDNHWPYACDLCPHWHSRQVLYSRRWQIMPYVSESWHCLKVPETVNHLMVLWLGWFHGWAIYPRVFTLLSWVMRFQTQEF